MSENVISTGKSIFRLLSLSKPPSSLAFSYGRFDASTSSATTGSTIVSTDTIVEQVDKQARKRAKHRMR